MTSGNEVIRFFGKHVALLECFDRSTKHSQDGYRSGELLTASGFIAACDEHWFFVTAGHVLQDWNDRIANEHQLTDFAVDDTWGSMMCNSDPIPFDYANSISEVRFDKATGLDYAAVYLDPYYVRLMKGNGIEPANIDECCPSPIPTDLDGYFVLGVPSELSEQFERGSEVRVSRSLTLLKMHRLDNPPSHWHRDIPRFFGQVELANEDMQHIEGMSGGPIIGIRQEKDSLRYFIIALQSTWDENTGKTTGSYIHGIKILMQSILDRLPT